MVEALRHRGPDDQGLVVDGPVVLGAARLSIIDVGGGHQPATTEDGRVSVAQNGEIYNYLELRRDLLGAHQFRSDCDTEVIAHLYEERGDATFPALRGMFAIAVWDARRRRLILARDRTGKKPLYYLRTARELLYASEPKAIVRALGTCPDVDHAALRSYLTFGYVDGPGAIFQGMHRVPPGGYLAVDAESGAERHECYWSWPRPSADANEPLDDLLERLRGTLDEAVRIRLRSDVPLGAFLSGGTDSAAVVGLMARHSARPVKTFTIGFGDAEYDELDDARITARYFGTEHHEWVLAPKCVEVAGALAAHFDEPFADASAIPTYYVSQLARRHVTVALTGDGGDELFAGYTLYTDAAARDRGKAADLLRSALSVVAERVPVHARGKGRLTTMSLGPEGWFTWRRSVFPDYLLRPILGPALIETSGPLPQAAALTAIRSDAGMLVDRLQRWDKLHYLPGDILVKVDRASMAHSLEARSPLLDQQLIELAATQPASRHIVGGNRKWLLQRALEPWVPLEVLARPKRGFGVPLRRWLQEGLIDWAREILLDNRTSARGWTSTQQVARLLLQHGTGTRDHANRIWALVVLELWAREHVDRPVREDLLACAL